MRNARLDQEAPKDPAVRRDTRESLWAQRARLESLR